MKLNKQMIAKLLLITAVLVSLVAFSGCGITGVAEIDGGLTTMEDGFLGGLTRFGDALVVALQSVLDAIIGFIEGLMQIIEGLIGLLF